MRCCRVCLLYVFMAGTAVGQSRPASDPQALSYAARSIAAMSGGMNITDMSLTGSVTWNSGADTGTATLTALGTTDSRMDLVLSSGTRTEIRDAQNGMPVGQWINPDNSSGPFAPQNCQTDAVWFFPALGSLAAGTNVVLLNVGQTTWNGTIVQHLQSYIYQPNLPSAITPSGRQLSTMDFYLDATSFLPVAVTFKVHPDSDINRDLLTEVDFSNYQNFASVNFPTHIQRYQQGALMVDVTVTEASVNTGLPSSSFTLN